MDEKAENSFACYIFRNNISVTILKTKICTSRRPNKIHKYRK